VAQFGREVVEGRVSIHLVVGGIKKRLGIFRTGMDMRGLHHPDADALIAAAIYVAGIFEGHLGIGGVQTADVFVAQALLGADENLPQGPIFHCVRMVKVQNSETASTSVKIVKRQTAASWISHKDTLFQETRTFAPFRYHPLNIMQKFLYPLLLLCTLQTAHAQLRYGFKTGLNFCTVKGDAELDAAGNSLEKWSNSTGFHIGMAVGYPFNDHFSVRGEFMYSKRGGNYTYEGTGYRQFKSGSTSTLATGNLTQNINTTISYLDFPIMAVGRWGDFEVSGGGYFGLKIQSIGEGGMYFRNGKTVLKNNTVNDLEYNLSYNYSRDDPGGTPDPNGDKLTVNLDGKPTEQPKTLGAYYDLTEDKGSLFNTLDYGVVVGAAYYISRSLYFGARLQYGLADITNTGMDVSKSKIGENNTLLFRDDKDRNFAIQASVGFNF
jgi:hypothetical protein